MRRVARAPVERREFALAEPLLSLGETDGMQPHSALLLNHFAC
jgi:hypothetical protein